MSIPNLGIDFDRIKDELGSDLGDIFGKVTGAAGGGLDRIANVAQSAGSGLERIAGAAGSGGPNLGLARIAAFGGGGSGNTLGNIAGYAGSGGGGLDFFEQLGGSNPFAAFENAQAMYPPHKEEEVVPLPGSGTPGAPGGTGVGATGADPATDKWRAQIDEAAARISRDTGVAVDGDALQALMMIESGGDPGATSAAGARGLNQVMPFHTQNPNFQKYGTDLYDPQTNLYYSAAILADNFKRYGDWSKAAAAYLGAIDANGNISGGDPYTGMSGNQYVAKFNENLQRIKARRATQPGGGAGYAGSAQGVASMYGGSVPPITQEFGRTQFSTGEGAGIYDFGSDMGLDGDSHTGWDVGSAVGTNFYMPKGLGGTVEIAGCTSAGCFYTDEQRGGGEGRGELRINLDNGMQLILGHNSNITVRPGQRVDAGMLLGQTGYANGAHQHVEVRVRDTSTRSGWRIIDPSVLFGNAR